MVKKSKGFRRGTRERLKHKCKVPITRFLKEYSVGDRVVIVPEPSSSKGIPFPRFKGKVGTVIEKRGRSYLVEVYEGNEKKKIVARSEHLKSINA